MLINNGLESAKKELKENLESEVNKFVDERTKEHQERKNKEMNIVISGWKKILYENGDITYRFRKNK